MQQTKNIKDLFADEVRSFSIYDCQRSLPSGVDGLKPAMRKIIYGMLKKFPSQEVKVSIAAAGIQEVSCYHHGSLEGTLVNMAKNYPGSNNLPFLEAIGQFGSRISPSAAASRYIFTKLTDSFRQIFRKEDDGILNHMEDDGTVIEPEYYLPIIPTVLLNGSEGTGTGFACNILNYNPLHLISACEEVLKHDKVKKDLVPWYSGYTGTIEKNDTQTIFTGKLEVRNTTTLVITELPIGSFTQKYRDVLNDLEDKGHVKSYVDDSAEEKTEFIVTCPRETLRKTEDELLKLFKLISRDTENFTVWLDNGKLKKFSYAKDLIEWFVGFRLGKYETRRQHLITNVSEKLTTLKERIVFIQYYLKHSKWFSETKKADIVAKLESVGFKNIDELLNIRVYNLTADQIEDLKNRVQEEETYLNTLENTTAKDMYLVDLHNLKDYVKTKKLC